MVRLTPLRISLSSIDACRFSISNIGALLSLITGACPPDLAARGRQPPADRSFPWCLAVRSAFGRVFRPRRPARVPGVGPGLEMPVSTDEVPAGTENGRWRTGRPRRQPHVLAARASDA